MVKWMMLENSNRLMAGFIHKHGFKHICRWWKRTCAHVNMMSISLPSPRRIFTSMQKKCTFHLAMLYIILNDVILCTPLRCLICFKWRPSFSNYKWVCTVLLIMISTVCIIYCPLESKSLRSDHKVSQGMFLDFGGIWRGKNHFPGNF